jgi:TatD DNase family protein
MKLFDCHCHLQDERLQEGLAEHLALARKVGVARFACCGVSEADWPLVAKLSDENDEIVPSYGLHPWEVHNRSPQWLKTLRQYLSNGPAGVGEIGLDHGIRVRNDKEQEEVFLAQLALAVELNRPVSIHCRRAFPTLIRLLSKHERPQAGFVVHSFSGSLDDMNALFELGAYFSFSGTCTFTRNKKAHRNIKAAPRERLLIETDCPDMYPLVKGEEHQQRGEKRVNPPANIVHPLRKAAELLDESEAKLAQSVWENANRLFSRAMKSDDEQI